MTRFDGANLLKRRLRDAGIVGDYSPHSFRATGITNYLENGGILEVATIFNRLAQCCKLARVVTTP